MRLSVTANERGATMAEFAMAIVIVLGLLGLVFDLGLSLYKYSLLTHATSKVSRNIAAKLDRHWSVDCLDINDEVEQRARHYLGDTLRISGAYSFQTTVFDSADPSQPANPDQQSVLRVKGIWAVDCFICMLSPKTVRVSTTTETLIENPEFYCN